MPARSTIGSLIVSIGANTGPFEKGMKKTRKGLKDFDKSATASAKTMKRLKAGLVGLGAAFTANRITQSFLRTTEAIDELGKTAGAIGIATQELQALRHAAEISGVSTGKLDKSLTRMTRQVSEAASGTGEARDAIKELGLSAEALNRLSPDKQFTAIAEALKGVKNQSDQVRIAYDLFGRESERLVPLLASGAAGVNKLKEEFKALGGQINDQEAKRIAEFRDSLTRLKAALGGVGQRLVIDIAPAATDAVNGLLEVVTGLRVLKQARDARERAAEPSEGLLGVFSDFFSSGIGSRFFQAGQSVLGAQSSATANAMGLNAVGTAFPAGALGPVQSLPAAAPVRSQPVQRDLSRDIVRLSKEDNAIGKRALEELKAMRRDLGRPQLSIQVGGL